MSLQGFFGIQAVEKCCIGLKLQPENSVHILLHRDFSAELHSLPFIIAHYNGTKTEQECKVISYELSSVMQLAIYRHNDIYEFWGYDLTDREQLRNFIDLQIDLFLKD